MSVVRNLSKGLRLSEDEQNIIKDAVKVINKNKKPNERKESFNNFIIDTSIAKAKRILNQIEK